MSALTIVFWVVVSLFCLAFLFVFRRFYPADYHTRDIAIDAMFVAIILIMGFVPQVGYISVLPWLSLTLMHLPVLLGAYLFGWKKGAVYGLVFGLTSWLEALSQGTGLNALFAFPWISIIPRFLFGLISGLIFQLIRKTPKIYKNGLVIGGTSFLLTCLHTILVFADLWLFYPTLIGGYFASGEPVISGLAYTFFGVVALGMCGEALLGAIIVPTVGLLANKIAK